MLGPDGPGRRGPFEHGLGNEVVGEGHAQPVQGGVQVGRGSVEMAVSDAQAMVGPGHVGSVVALGPAECLAEERDDVPAVQFTDAAGKKRPSSGSASGRP
jgi:hypothetical protein